ncbi:MAG: hypothetical protein HKO53_11275, partial [Gemmatimonadetes bacterium]|nr:hypothetical protein [Gemmatimonadota bacterium]
MSWKWGAGLAGAAAVAIGAGLAWVDLPEKRSGADDGATPSLASAAPESPTAASTARPPEAAPGGDGAATLASPLQDFGNVPYDGEFTFVRVQFNSGR